MEAKITDRVSAPMGCGVSVGTFITILLHSRARGDDALFFKYKYL